MSEHSAESDGHVTVTTLLHSFNRWTGMCRCGAGPFITAEWVAHYKGQDEPVRITVITDEGGSR